MNSVTQQACRAPCVISVINHWYTNDLCLVLDEFFSFFENFFKKLQKWFFANRKFWSQSWPKWTEEFYKHSPNSRVHVEVLHFIRRFSIVSLCHNRIGFVHVTHDFRGYVENMWPFPSFGFPDFSSSWTLQDIDSETPVILDSPLLRRVSSRCHPSTCQGKHLSASLENSALRQVSNFFSSCLPVSCSCAFHRMWGCSHFFTDEELAGTVDDRFIAVSFDFATNCSSSFCSCTLFAIFLEQLIKLEFFAQQLELEWLILNRWRRLFHLSRVKLLLVKTSASWCLVSMYLIEILGSRLSLSKTKPKQLGGFLTRVSLWDSGLWLSS